MKAATFFSTIVRPGLAFMAETLGNDKIATPEAELLVQAIAHQESNCHYRKQQPGPARGFWQFERGGGFRGVREHARTAPMLDILLKELNLPARGDEEALWLALPESELLQVCFARLLLWSDAAALPVRGDIEGGWSAYLRNWRPGKPHRDRWSIAYQGALAVSDPAPRAPTFNLAALDAINQIERLIGSLRSALRSEHA